MCRSSLRVFSGSATAVIALALMATCASANWFIAGSQLAGSAALASTAKTEKPFVLEGGGLQVECSGELEGNPEIKASESLTATSLTFTGCKTDNANCLVPPTISSLPIVAEFFTGESPKVKSLVRPITGTTIATIKFSGEKCAPSGVKTVTGDFEATLPSGGEEKTIQLLEVNQAATGLLKIATSAASLTGSAAPKLAPPKPWEFVGWLHILSGWQFLAPASGKQTQRLVIENEPQLTYTGVNVASLPATEKVFKAVAGSNTCTGLFAADKTCHIDIEFLPTAKSTFAGEAEFKFTTGIAEAEKFLLVGRGD